MTQIRALFLYLSGTVFIGLGLLAVLGGTFGAALFSIAIGGLALWYGSRLKAGVAHPTAILHEGKAREQRFYARLRERHWQTGAILVAVNVVAFALLNLRSVDWLGQAPPNLMLRWGASFPPLNAHAQPWRLVTSQFLHLDLGHLIGNVIALFIVGRYVDYLVGRTRMILIYLSTGVIAGLTQGAFAPVSLCAGASGAIMGLEGVLISALVFGRPDGKPMPITKMSLGYLFYHAWTSVTAGFGQSSIANGAHVGGFVAGFLAYAAFVKLRSSEEDSYVILGGGTLAAFLFCSVFTHVPTPKAGLAQLARAGQLQELVRRYEAFNKILDRSKAIAKQPSATEDQIMAKIQAEVMPALDKAYDTLYAFRTDDAEIYALQANMIYQCGYARQGMQFALANDSAGTNQAIASAKAYGMKTTAGLDAFVQHARHPAGS